MQIIKLWFKISAFLAIAGWATHAMNPEFAAWWDGLFQKNEAVQTTGQDAGDHAPPPDAGAIRADRPSPPRPAYKLND